MIKVIIFDLDGVLVDTKEIHFLALNEALEKFNAKKVISKHCLLYTSPSPRDRQ